ncbi:ABC transporter ATP-binding protein [Ramlibacter rhizophilus]|uniref:ATP-binding cassette domain-containing protein n=1 Tax=Ramlibacter rhizophilus TaxID=1781167 RepID=A0A4Z0BKP3_9BURK|nr:ATP-binding cassette domain-containing protein [Ramlibacter rhizophilus]TFY98664.1 ATP-binding cassette domain-containing protein [Ramlibacter rhizophilus]
MSTAFLELKALSFAHGGAAPTLAGVDLDVPRGELHCLLGRSGCGKTTLLKLAAGLVEPRSGHVRLRGRPPAQARADIGFVFQSPTLLEWHSVLDNVLLPISLQRRPAPADRDRALHLLARLGLDGLAQRHPRQLSGGQQSRAALARALLPAPPLLLLDEPFAALDAITREELQQDLLRLCADEGSTVLFVTHDIAEAVYLGDRVSVMAGGRLARTLVVDLPRPRPPGLRAHGTFARAVARVRAALEDSAGVCA